MIVMNNFLFILVCFLIGCCLYINLDFDDEKALVLYASAI